MGGENVVERIYGDVDWEIWVGEVIVGILV